MEKSRVPSKKLLLIGAIVIGAVAIAFSQMTLRAKGRIVEFCTLGEWPLEWAVRRHFARKQPELSSILDFVNEAPEVTGLTVTPLGLRASLQQYEGEKHDLDEPNILQALISIESKFVNIDENRVSVYLGWEVRGDSAFEVSYEYRTSELELVDCENIAARDRAKFGSCVFVLSPEWYALYQWYPDDTDEFRKELDKLR